MRNVKAVDKEDGDLTNKVKHKGDVDTSKPYIHCGIPGC